MSCLCHLKSFQLSLPRPWVHKSDEAVCLATFKLLSWPSPHKPYPAVWYASNLIFLRFRRWKILILMAMQRLTSRSSWQCAANESWWHCGKLSKSGQSGAIFFQPAESRGGSHRRTDHVRITSLRDFCRRVCMIMSMMWPLLMTLELCLNLSSSSTPKGASFQTWPLAAPRAKPGTKSEIKLLQAWVPQVVHDMAARHERRSKHVLRNSFVSGRMQLGWSLKGKKQSL